MAHYDRLPGSLRMSHIPKALCHSFKRTHTNTRTPWHKLIHTLFSVSMSLCLLCRSLPLSLCVYSVSIESSLSLSFLLGVQSFLPTSESLAHALLSISVSLSLCLLLSVRPSHSLSPSPSITSPPSVRPSLSPSLPPSLRLLVCLSLQLYPFQCGLPSLPHF
jgi:hypothetical protein